MARITFKGNTIHTTGELPGVGSIAPEFTLVRTDLSSVSLGSYQGRKILNIFPSIDTSVCAASVRAFNQKATSKQGVTVLHISMDLPFAHARFCVAEGLDRVESLSAFRSSFPLDYGVQIADGPLEGLCSRAVVVLGGDNRVLYTQQVPDIAQEPDYEAALAALRTSGGL